jgi:hypothetical protein
MLKGHPEYSTRKLAEIIGITQKIFCYPFIIVAILLISPQQALAL